MDCRLTIGESESFREMLTECMTKKEKVEMIYDRDGLTRAGGTVDRLYTDNGKEYIQLSAGETIALAEIVAVNGVFAAAYAGC